MRPFPLFPFVIRKYFFSNICCSIAGLNRNHCYLLFRQVVFLKISEVFDCTARGTRLMTHVSALESPFAVICSMNRVFNTQGNMAPRSALNGRAGVGGFRAHVR